MNILLPVDGSQNSLSAVRYVMAMKDRLREPTAIYLINVQIPVASGAVKRFISQQQLNDYYQDEGVKAMAGARALLDQAGVPYEHHIGVGDVAATLAGYAREKGCSQIVLGARGAGGIAGALLGSTATRVAQLADVPVTLVK